MTASLPDDVVALLEATPVGTLAVRSGTSAVHQSVVYHRWHDGRLLVSTERDRVKARAVARHGWVSYSVRGDVRPYPSVTVEGPAEVVDGPGAGALTALVVARIVGEEVAPMTDDEVAAVGRVVLVLRPDRAYAASYLDQVPDGP